MVVTTRSVSTSGPSGRTTTPDRRRGLRRYGYHYEAPTIAFAILEAAQYFLGRLPETFAGYERALTDYPVEYPTACSPQAWATGAPLFLLRVLLGLEARSGVIEQHAVLPEGIRELALRDLSR